MAEGGFGITGGASFVGLKEATSGFTTGYHAGLTYKLDLPFGFAIQPSLLYHMKGSVVKEAYENGADIDFRTGYLELPVSFQWGPDLILFRPFFDVTPFVGYGMNNSISVSSLVDNAVSNTLNQWEGINRLEYGLGLGLGLDLWKLQVIGRYNWNFGSLFDVDGNLPEEGTVLENIKSSLFKGNNYGGLTLSVALFF